MNRRLSALAVAASSALLLAGCSGSSSPATTPSSTAPASTTTTTTPQVTVAEWTDELCSKLGPNTKLLNADEPPPEVSRDSYKEMIIVIFQLGEKRSKEAAVLLDGVGAPPVADGEKLFEGNKKKLGDFITGITGLSAELAKLQGLSEAQFETASAPVLAKAEALGEVDPIAYYDTNNEIKAALRDTASCKGVYTG
jgi:hypothetical protein